MNEQQKRDKQIKRLQQNLLSIRKIAGWTAQQLGDKIGVTKQTISNLENGKTDMNFAQYIAIRAILDYEIETNKENDILPKVITILLDKSDEINDEDGKEAEDDQEHRVWGHMPVKCVTSNIAPGKTSMKID
jgi:transcriptional regulator with XRE-family HTH domain